MVGQHHRVRGCELGQAPGDSEEQEYLMCFSPWGHKESDVTWRLNNRFFGVYAQEPFLTGSKCCNNRATTNNSQETISFMLMLLFQLFGNYFSKIFFSFAAASFSSLCYNSVMLCFCPAPREDMEEVGISSNIYSNTILFGTFLFQGLFFCFFLLSNEEPLI